MSMRSGNRANDEKRPLRITTDYTRYAEGSVLIETGETRVLCTATVEDKVPGFLRGTGKGWVTAEYSMLPRATAQRNSREIEKNKKSPRSSEIQRLIGRSLRSVVDLEALGERSIIIDCDVLQADGGTRTASITGGFLALELAVKRMIEAGELLTNPIRDHVAAISVGLVRGVPMLDLDYSEDSGADVDMNVVMDGSGNFSEIQGTGENRSFSEGELAALLALAKKGNAELIEAQRAAVAMPGPFAPVEKLCIATHNEGKLREMRALLAPLGIEAVSADELGITDEITEDGATFEENAMKKAEGMMRLAGIPAVADDSGLCVDALSGAPGIFSARYGGEGLDDAERTALLLENMKDVPYDRRGAQFVSAVAFAAPDGRRFVVRGSCPGKILFAPAGESGFGYDPVFFDETFGKTFAELDPRVKNGISHRAAAMRLFAERMRSIVRANVRPESREGEE